MAADYARIPVDPSTRDRIRDLKQPLDSYDELLNRMADQYEASGSATSGEEKAHAER